jgi:hypothetical protein
MTSPAEALVHELRNALVPLDIGLQCGTATLEDAAAVVKRLFEFADGIEADLRRPEEMHKAGLRSMDLCAIIVAREAEIDTLKRRTTEASAAFTDLAYDIETSSTGDAPAARLRALVEQLQGARIVLSLC